MADDLYYGDQPHFEKKDPLTTWSLVFIIAAAAATLWMFILWYLWSQELLAKTDELFRIPQVWWVAIAAIILIGSVIGMFFVIVARIGGTSAGGYISTEIEAPRARVTEQHHPAPQPANEPEELFESAAHTERRPPARIEEPFGPDGRMLASYTVPENQPRGIYGDTYVAIDRDAVLNIKTLLAKTINPERA